MKYYIWIGRNSNGNLVSFGRKKPVYDDGFWDVYYPVYCRICQGTPLTKSWFQDIKPGKCKKVWLEE